MILSVHMIAGAALSRVIPDPILLAPAAVLLHLACDVAPHWEYDFMHTPKKRAAMKIAADIAAGLVSIVLFSNTSSADLMLALWGGFFGILPDGLLAIHLFSEKKYLSRFARFHSFFHTRIIPLGTHPPVWLGLLTQGALLALAVYTLLYR